jgi:hypothetical protein
MTSTFVRPVEIEGPDQGSLEGRASLGLKALAALNGFGVILAFFPPPVPPARLLTVSFNLASLLLVVLMLVEARGLDRLRPWAIAAVRPFLVVIGLAGLYVFVTSILAGKVRIPLDVGVAIWALLAGPHVTPRPSFGAKSLVVSSAALGLSALMLFSQPLFDWGGVVDVKEPDLRTSMSVDCGTAAPDGTVPEVIKITYDWSWTSSSPLPDGLDAFVVGWTGDDGEGRPLYLLGVTPDTEPGVYSGRRGHPSRDMTDEAAEESRGWWHWGIELAERGYAPGHVVVELRRAQRSTPDPEPLLIKASYIHLGVFRQDVEPVTCTW